MARYDEVFERAVKRYKEYINSTSSIAAFTTLDAILKEEVVKEFEALEGQIRSYAYGFCG